MPGVDDGAQTPSDAAAALDQFRAEGARQIITTPHFAGSLTQDAARLEERMVELDAGWSALQAVVVEDATRHGSAMRMERGVEVMLGHPLVTSGHCLACRRGDDMHAEDSRFPGITGSVPTVAPIVARV